MDGQLCVMELDLSGLQRLRRLELDWCSIAAITNLDVLYKSLTTLHWCWGVMVSDAVFVAAVKKLDLFQNLRDLRLTSTLSCAMPLPRLTGSAHCITSIFLEGNFVDDVSSIYNYPALQDCRMDMNACPNLREVVTAEQGRAGPREAAPRT